MDIKIQDFKSIELSDKDIFEKYLSTEKKQNSDASFANLYMWKNVVNLKLVYL